MAQDLIDDETVTVFGMLTDALTRLRDLTHQDLGVPETWFEVLLCLGRAPEHALRVTELATAISFSSGGFTRLADRIEQAGLVRRTPDPEDRRAAFVVLTDAGREVLDQALARHAALVREHLTNRLNAHERRSMLRIAHKLKDCAELNRPR
ncbi:MarR family transcriptional regulator [Kutzneria viridogrisea]|uniref:HTH marR-type domain-containing protein n=2 Tax=Kutzneria TaxID=43356 RepID=W5WBW0_9PSEU|nr:MarR family transcriptional regulator [Kutzneria albida]AHH98392.1 hypothetical protein KALB_5030 [Kutzneria albida DSM 43870]MBA8924088.1 DNA-binding MarR family transcriptional regulator [Kutzneria viridogrisea]